jgi:hypothetical protein
MEHNLRAVEEPPDDKSATLLDPTGPDQVERE